jgi:hypothetical protein
MRGRVAGWLRALADWLDPSDRHRLDVPRDAVYQAAVTHVTEAERLWPRGHGEAKRHHVLAKLEKQFPAHRKRRLAHALEAAHDR